MDLITGKALREVFFCPDACLDLDQADADWLVQHLYHPVRVTQESGKELTVSAGEGDHEVFLRMAADKVSDVRSEHKEGED